MKDPRNTTKVHLSPQALQAVNHILLTWGRFTLLELGESLNFLPKNALEMLSKLGMSIHSSVKQLKWPLIIEQADKLIGQLSKYKPRWAETLKWRYLKAGTIRGKAKQQGLYKSTYYERLTKGRLWMAKQLKIILC